MDRKEALIAAARSVAERLDVRKLPMAEFVRETGITTAMATAISTAGRRSARRPASCGV